jgi:hypothetical protein
VSFVVGLEVGYYRGFKRSEYAPKNNAPVELADRTRTENTPSAERKEKRLPKRMEVAPKAKESPRPGEPAKPIQPARKTDAPPKPVQPPKSTSLVMFDTQVLPLFKARCIRCHGGRKTKGELDMRSIAALIAGGESGPGIKPGNVEDSVVWHYIARDKMPPGKKNKLTVQEKNLIREWIMTGAK